MLIDYWLGFRIAEASNPEADSDQSSGRWAKEWGQNEPVHLVDNVQGDQGDDRK
jgi:hypothetical protein